MGKRYFMVFMLIIFFFVVINIYAQSEPSDTGSCGDGCKVQKEPPTDGTGEIGWQRDDGAWVVFSDTKDEVSGKDISAGENLNYADHPEQKLEVVIAPEYLDFLKKGRNILNGVQTLDDKERKHFIDDLIREYGTKDKINDINDFIKKLNLSEQQTNDLKTLTQLAIEYDALKDEIKQKIKKEDFINKMGIIDNKSGINDSNINQPNITPTVTQSLAKGSIGVPKDMICLTGYAHLMNAFDGKFDSNTTLMLKADFNGNNLIDDGDLRLWIQSYIPSLCGQSF